MATFFPCSRTGDPDGAARAAAGGRAVRVVGVSVCQQLLRAGLADELHVDVMPVLLGAGLHFFQHADLERVQLEKIRVQEVGARTCFTFRVREVGGKVAAIV